MDISRVKETAFISGVIDENSDFSPILLPPWPTNIDFSGVQRVNSIGLRTWMLFLTKWGDKPLNYLNCTTSISDQLVMVPALFGIPKKVVKVLSAMISYDCPKCKHAEDLMIKYDNVHPVPSPEALAPKCRICFHEMELVEAGYLSIF